MTNNKNKTPWKNETWHKIKVVRDSKKGTIEVYFDDMTKPHMSVVDKPTARAASASDHSTT